MPQSIRWPSEGADPSPLGRPLQFAFSGKEAHNRFLKASLTERISSWDPVNIEARGIPSSELINLYKRWGEGGFGIVLTGNILIDLEHLEAAGNPVIPRTAPFHGPRFEAFRAVAAAAKAHGSLCIGQVNHPGRQCMNAFVETPISASDVQLEVDFGGMEFNKPRAATQEDIDGIVDGFGHAAEYLEKAGYDGIQLHCGRLQTILMLYRKLTAFLAHGYLLAQFISPTTNRRIDKYGGDIENRARILTEIADEVRKRTSPTFSISIKLNSVEFQESGLQPEDAKKVCSILEAKGFDWVELSGGTYQKLAWDYSLYKRESTRKREAFFMDFADMIAPSLKKTKVYVTGGFKTVGAMVDAVSTIDGVGLGRPACQEPNLAKDILSGKVKGAIRIRLDETNFGLQVVAAGTQMQQISRDQTPIDFSQKDLADAFAKDMGTWMEKVQQDKGRKMNGYVDITSVSPIPYGTARAALA